ncbi:MAG: hypothetical protein HC814_00040 [Rhodobacteraceae bacterium]|nr:hypothetical protein [Paracoccaceae bacterium]
MITNFVEPNYEYDERIAAPVATSGSAAIITAGAMIAGGMASIGLGRDGLSASEAARNEVQNNRLLHVSEHKLLRDKAKELASQETRLNPEQQQAREEYWYRLLVSEAQAMVDARQFQERERYLNQIFATIDGQREGTYMARYYLADVAVARVSLSTMTGQPIIDIDGRPIIADGSELRTFQVTNERQYLDQQLFASGTPPWIQAQQFTEGGSRPERSLYVESQSANASALRQISYDNRHRLDTYSVINGSAEPVTVVDELLIGGGGEAVLLLRRAIARHAVSVSERETAKQLALRKASDTQASAIESVTEEIASLYRMGAGNPGAAVFLNIEQRAARDRLQNLVGHELDLRWMSSLTPTNSTATGRLGETLSDDLLAKLNLPTRSLKNNSDHGVDLLTSYDPVRNEYIIFEVKTSEVSKFSSLPNQTPRSFLEERANRAQQALGNWAESNTSPGTRTAAGDILDNLLNSRATVKGYKIEVQIPKTGQSDRAIAVITEWQ